MDASSFVSQSTGLGIPFLLREERFTERLAECGDLDWKIARLVQDERFLEQCTYPHLQHLRERLGRSEGSGESIQSALDLLDRQLEAEKKERKGTIAMRASQWTSLERCELLRAIKNLVDELMVGATGQRPCSGAEAMGEILGVLAHMSAHRAEPLPCSVFELKTGCLHERALPSLSSRICEILKRQTSVTIRKPIEEWTNMLCEQRKFCLKNLNSVAALVMLDPNSQVCLKFYPTTGAWLVGAKKGAAGNRCEWEIEQIANKHGIQLVGTSWRAVDTIRENTLLLSTQLRADWPQDAVDFTSQEVRVPVIRTSAHDSIDFAVVIQSDRRKRSKLWERRDLTDTPLLEAVQWVSSTWERKPSEVIMGMTPLTGTPTVMNLTYNEGGNTLLGLTKSGKPCAIVGLDTVAATRAILSLDLGHPVSEEELLAAFRVDYGIEDIYYVEQPCDFHLDMSMVFVAPGVIVLNDSRAAQTLYETDLRRRLRAHHVGKEEIEQCVSDSKTHAEDRALFEDLVAGQLKKSGVHCSPVRRSILPDLLPPS